MYPQLKTIKEAYKAAMTAECPKKVDPDDWRSKQNEIILKIKELMEQYK